MNDSSVVSLERPFPNPAPKFFPLITLLRDEFFAYGLKDSLLNKHARPVPSDWGLPSLTSSSFSWSTLGPPALPFFLLAKPSTYPDASASGDARMRFLPGPCQVSLSLRQKEPLPPTCSRDTWRTILLPTCRGCITSLFSSPQLVFEPLEHSVVYSSFSFSSLVPGP